jgi:hypothetical protein
MPPEPSMFGESRITVDDQGEWSAIPYKDGEFQVFIPHRPGQAVRDFSVYWQGTATPHMISDWAASALNLFVGQGQQLTCQMEIWADEAPPPKEYTVEIYNR